MQYNFSDDLQVGDTIIISEGNWLRLGFFAGRGRNTIQFYIPSQVVYTWEKDQQHKRDFELKRCWKSYVKDASWRIAKVTNPVFGKSDEEESYKKATEILKEIKFIKK